MPRTHSTIMESIRVVESADKLHGHDHTTGYHVRSDLQGQQWVRIAILGQSFMLNQIRRMVGMAVAVARGLAPPDAIRLALEPRRTVDVPMAPAVGLLLVECIFQSYNQRWAQQHGQPLTLEHYADAVREFKVGLFSGSEPCQSSMSSATTHALSSSILPVKMFTQCNQSLCVNVDSTCLPSLACTVHDCQHMPLAIQFVHWPQEMTCCVIGLNCGPLWTGGCSVHRNCRARSARMLHSAIHPRHFRQRDDLPGMARSAVAGPAQVRQRAGQRPDCWRPGALF